MQQRLTENIKTWALGGLLGLTLASIPVWAKAGIGSFLVEKVAEKAVDAAKDRAVEAAKARLPERTPVALPPEGGFQSCARLFPQARPLEVAKVDQQWRPHALCANNFAVLYSGLSKTPLVVVERLSKAQLADALDEERTNEFYPDPRVPRDQRAELADFVGTGLDRGHLAPAGDMPDATAMAQSFVLTNIVPQNAVNNRKGGAWFKAESDTRKYARRATGDVYVFSGPLFRGRHQTIGRSKVWVPTHLFKLVYDEAGRRAWAHIVENTAEARLGPPVDYATFVREAGWQLLGQPPGAAQ